MKNVFNPRNVIFIFLCLLLLNCGKKENYQLLPQIGSENLNVTLLQAKRIANLEMTNGSVVSKKSTRTSVDSSGSRGISDAKTYRNEKDNSDAFHVINHFKVDSKTNLKQSAGFTIISADKRIVPILASSETGRFETENILKGVDIWVEMVLNEIKLAKSNLKEPTPTVAYLWEQYDSKPKNGRTTNPYPVCPSGSHTNTGILINTTWSQDATYNLSTPMNGCSSCGRANTGCGPTAIAQVWNYYQKPVSYPSANGSTYYDYPLAVRKTGDYCDLYTTPIKEMHMAVLLSTAGIAAQTNYNYAGSCSALTWRNDVKTAFIYAGYSNSGQRGGLIDNLTTVNSELINGKPVIIDGNTSLNFNDWHIWIIDGYDSYTWFTPESNPPYTCIVNSYTKYHLNWGWEGASDGWYVLYNFVGRGEVYDYALNVTFGMRP